MSRFGYFLATEDSTPVELISQAQQAQEAGFDALWISDHFHPWTHEQGQASFVWSVIGALSRETDLPITTAVTCPTVRTHPAVIAQAAATTAAMVPGGFVLGLGSGEALNEQVTGAPWPMIDTRLDMLAEAVEIMRALWTGEVVFYRGQHYTVEHARLYTLPENPPPLYLSGFGPKAVDLAARVADGYIAMMPASDLVQRFNAAGGGRKPKQGGMKVAVAPTAREGAENARRQWPNEGLPGELGQVLRTPEHIMQAASLVTVEQMQESVVCGPDAGAHVDGVRAYLEAGFDDVFVSQIGPDKPGFFSLYHSEVLPELRRG